ncbi:MAG: PAS domain S-box protein, partial [Gemmatimonadaceae bacterium]
MNDSETCSLLAELTDASHAMVPVVTYETSAEPHDPAANNNDFRMLFAANPLAMWIYDVATLRFLEVNDAAMVSYGYTRSEFLNMTIKDIRPPADVDRLLQSIAEGRTSWLCAGHWRHQYKSGEIIDVEITSHLLTFGGRPASLVVAQDISQRQRAELAQRASDSQYRKLFDASPDGLVIADGAGNYLDGNPSICRMLGYTREEFVQLNAIDVVLPVCAGKLADALAELKLSRDHQHEMHFRRKDGSTFIAEVTASPMNDGRVLGIIRDVTERNNAIAALSAAEERMRYAMQSAGIGVWDMNFATGELTWSEVLEAQYGLPPGAFAGTFDSYFARIHPDDREAMRASFETANRSGADFSVDHRIIWPDGKVRWVNGQGRIKIDETGKPVRGIGISIDITDRRTLEEQYQQAQKMEAVGRLAGGVAHDFNNLLTAILGYCELLLDDCPVNTPHHLELSEIQKAGQRAAGLTRQLLAFSRREIIAPSLLNLSEVVTGLESLLRRLIGEDLDVQIRLQPELPLIMADRGQVEQILMNLAVNARDAMPNGGALTIETSRVQIDEHYQKTHLTVVPGDYVALTVTDSGTGMTPEVQRRIFEPFFTTKEVGKGTGLGLATVHGIVKRSGGSVGVYSEVGRGTVIKVYFPVANASDTPVAVAAPTRANAGAETILVVEDENGLRELIRRLLLRQGYTVHIAANGDEALRLFNRIRFDAVLTDVVMPGASGPDLIESLIDRQPGLKVLFMS